MANLRLRDLTVLKGQVALVTGAGTGIGRMIARGLAANGARVYITGRRLNVLREAAEEGAREGLDLIPIQMDVSNKEGVEKAVKVLREKEGKLHILVNNAGGAGPHAGFTGDPSAPERKDTETFGRALFDFQTFEDWNNVFQLNVSALFFCTVAFMGLLQEGAKDLGEGETSSVINISSAIAIGHVSLGRFAYASSKAAVNHLTRMMATDFALQKVPIRVNAIAPGIFNSQLVESSGIPEFMAASKIVPGTISPAPTKRPGRSVRLTTTLSLVATAGYINGQIVVVDGGYHLVNP
ncbi:short-chain dehydrogenase [Heliocybe sulcata]|uniref:Short-chain dehydrogenase n=1 Tax=Heliocybe sulcata TaxID=5364 RepID=A0A5C3MPQ8_9AGAM|nr:short-chain dehydrogenase [Heliocybe sulcata]